MAASKIVIDTNVVVKFFLRETGSVHARGVACSGPLRDIELLAPDFMLAEFVNVLWLKAGRGELDDQEAGEIIARLLVLTELIEIIPSRRMLGTVFQTARRHSHSAYDAVFLTLAEDRGICLVTADTKFYQKTRSLLQGRSCSRIGKPFLDKSTSSANCRQPHCARESGAATQARPSCGGRRCSRKPVP